MDKPAKQVSPPAPVEVAPVVVIPETPVTEKRKSNDTDVANLSTESNKKVKVFIVLIPHFCSSPPTVTYYNFHSLSVGRLCGDDNKETGHGRFAIGR